MILIMDLISECLFLFVLIIFVSYCEGDKFPSCSINDLDACGNVDGAVCNEKTKKCECASGYEYSSETLCVKYAVDPSRASTESEGSSVTAVVVIFITIGLLGTALVFITRRYKLITWAQQRLWNRRNTGATYEDVMIGQDDPPITA